MILLFSACMNADHISFDDDLDTTADLAKTHEEGLNTPYVRGAEFTVTISRDGVGDVSSWQLVSSDSSVLDVVDVREGEDLLSATVHAVGEGEARIEVHDARDRLVDARVVEVAFPASVELTHENALRVGRDTPQDFAIARYGQGIYLTRYLDTEGRELAGHGVLELDDSRRFVSDVLDSHLSEAADWVVLEGMLAGAGEVAFVVDGEVASSREIEVVWTDEVTEIEVFGESETMADELDTLIVWAVGTLPDGREVHGIQARWTASEMELTLGDTQSYHPGGDQTSLKAHLGELQDGKLVHASGFVGNVDGSVGCSATGGVAMSGILGLLALLGLRRRA